MPCTGSLFLSERSETPVYRSRSTARRSLPAYRLPLAAKALRHRLLDLDPPLRQLLDVALRGHAFVGRVHAGGPDFAARLHLTGDRERVPRRAHHRADPVLLVITVDELEGDRLRLAALLAFD